MKLKQEFLVSAIAGLAAGILRFVQYFTTIDKVGYYKPGTLSNVLHIALVILLGIGILWGILCSVFRKKNLSYTNLFHTRPWVGALFGILAVSTGAEGAYLLVASPLPIQKAAAAVILAGAIAWLLLAIKGDRAPGIAAVLPVLQLSIIVLLYFWNTYKFIQVSEYAIVLLGLCSLCFFSLLILKSVVGAECTRGRINAASCFVVTFGLSAFVAPLAHSLSLITILHALDGICFMVLAAVALNPVTGAGSYAPGAAPDLTQMKEYLSDLPEVEEE